MGSRGLKRILSSLRLLATVLNYFLAGNYLWFWVRCNHKRENLTSELKAKTVL